MPSFKDQRTNTLNVSDNGKTPYMYATPRLPTPILGDGDPEGLDVLRTSSAADWNGSAPRPATAPADEMAFTDIPSPPEAEASGHGLHAITRKTDYWFEREIHSIEKGAREQAAEWALRGLPRHDVVRTEPLEPEQVLAAHCAQLFREWQNRVRTKVQDAIEEGSQAVGRQVAALRNAVTQLEAIRSENADLAERMKRLRAEAEHDAGKPVRYERYIEWWAFWFGATVLFVVEFFANFPVFRLMLPMSRALTTAALAAGENVNDTSWLAGPEILLREMLMHFEAAVVALVAVFVLVLLGKTVGASIRPLMAFRAADYPLAAQTIRSHHRQKGMLAVFGTLGLGCALTFLYLSRGSIASTADERVVVETQHIDTLVARRARLTDRTTIGQATGEIASAEQNKRYMEDDAAYARTVEKNNLPILGLNLALILTALVLGYSHKAEDLSDKRGEHPEITAARDRLSQIDREMFAVLGQGRQAQSQAHGDIARVDHLLRASPLRAAQSKRERLEGVIPLFRGENARLRGLDPANIRAFDLPAALELPPVNLDETAQEPNEFARLRQELQTIGTEFGRLAPRMTPTFGQPVIS